MVAGNCDTLGVASAADPVGNGWCSGTVGSRVVPLSRGFDDSLAGDIGPDCVRDATELCALGFALPGILFFRSLLGARFSMSDVGERWNKAWRFFSLLGVVTSAPDSRSRSWLRPPAWEPGARFDVTIGVTLEVVGDVCSGEFVGSSFTVGGGATAVLALVTGDNGDGDAGGLPVAGDSCRWKRPAAT